MNRGLPAPAQSLLQSEPRISQPTLIQEITGAVGQDSPDQPGNRVDHKPKAIPGLQRRNHAVGRIQQRLQPVLRNLGGPKFTA